MGAVMPLVLPQPPEESDPAAERADEGQGLRLAPLLDTPHAPLLAKEILGRQGAALTLDAGAVELLGGRCAEVLLAAAKQWREDGAPFRLRGPSEAFRRDCGLLGLPDAALGLEA